MLRCLAEVDASEPAKDAAYEALLPGFSDPAAYRARHLARSGRFGVERLDAFLELHPDPWLLELLLATELEDPAKRTLVEARAGARADHAELAAALALHRARAQAAAPELSAETARSLFETGDAEVWLVLAENPGTPREILAELAKTRDQTHARHIRGRASVNLKRRGNAGS